MSKKEFLAGLEEALLENMDIAEASQHIRYYREYIESEVDKGREEKEVVESLYSPRLVAKNIINNSDSANKYDSSIDDYSSDKTSSHQQYNNASFNKSEKATGGYTFSINGKPVNSFWMKLIAIVTIVVFLIVVLAVIGGIMWLFFKFVFPVISIIAVVWIIVKVVSNLKN